MACAASARKLIKTPSSVFVVTLLLALPTLVSLIRHHGPRQFGTDHIAGIMGAWAVVGIFGELIRFSRY